MAKVVVLGERCKGCELCLSACPKGLLQMSPEYNQAGYHMVRTSRQEECTGCALCAQMCPDVALEVYR